MSKVLEFQLQNHSFQRNPRADLLQNGLVGSPYKFSFHYIFTLLIYIKPNARLEESQAGIKIAGKKINNLRYADDTPLMAESEEELKSLLMKVNRRVKKLA